MCAAFSLSVKLFLSQSAEFSHINLSNLSLIPLGWTGGKWVSGFVGLCCWLGLSCDKMLPNTCWNRFSTETNQGIEQIITPPWAFRGAVLCAEVQLLLMCLEGFLNILLKFWSLFFHWLSSVQVVLYQVFKDEMVMTICTVHMLSSQNPINANKNTIVVVHMRLIQIFWGTARN